MLYKLPESERVCSGICMLNELMLNATPQNVDFTPQNGNYCVTLIATRPVHTWGYQKRNFKIKGRLEEGKTISADLIAENEMLFGVENLPYVAHESDRTPIFKIIRASIFCAYAGLQLTDLHRGMRKIAWSDYPFKKSDKEEQAKAEIRFMKRLASVMTVPDHCMIGRSVVTHLTSTRLRDVILYNKEYEPSLYEKIKDSIESLSHFIPAKDHADNVVPDVFVSQQDWENPRDIYGHQVIILNAKSKKKELFWWDYLKLNIFLSDLEYYFGYYILMNRWQIPMIQKWIAEYREKGLFESQRAKDYLLFYLKAGEKTPVRVLNSQGVQVNIKMVSR